MSVDLWGAFAKPLAPTGSSGMIWAVNQNKCEWDDMGCQSEYMRLGWYGLSIKINADIWLAGDTVTPWQWDVHWMETQSLAIFLLFKKGTATSMFNHSPALYRNICSICVHILCDVSIWTPQLCFSEVRKHVDRLKSLYSPTSFLTIKVNFDKIQFEDYCIYPSNSLLWLKYILLTSKRFLGFSIRNLDNYLCYEDNLKKSEKYILYKICNISKNKAPIGKRGYRFREKPCMYHYRKEKLK